MRVGVAGKGGVGKTTIAAVLARTFARRGHRVVAVDCDSDPNLGLGLGLSAEEADGVRPLLKQEGTVRSLPTDPSPDRLLEEYGHPGPDGVTLLVGAQVRWAGSG